MCSSSSAGYESNRKVYVSGNKVRLETSRKTMHWTMSVDTILHSLLFCAHIIIINNLVSVHGDIAAGDNKSKPDYIHFDGTKYLVENETYHSEKRLIIEEYFRQSATSAKNNFKDDYKFHVNMSETTESVNSADVKSSDDESQHRHKDEGNKVI